MRKSQPAREGLKPLRWTQPERHGKALAWLLFALTVWKLLPHYNSAFVFLVAKAVWLALAILTWRIWRKHLCR
jgi:hypothetical protein